MITIVADIQWSIVFQQPTYCLQSYIIWILHYYNLIDVIDNFMLFAYARLCVTRTTWHNIRKYASMLYIYELQIFM